MWPPIRTPCWCCGKADASSPISSSAATSSTSWSTLGARPWRCCRRLPRLPALLGELRPAGDHPVRPPVFRAHLFRFGGRACHRVAVGAARRLVEVALQMVLLWWEGLARGVAADPQGVV